MSRRSSYALWKSQMLKKKQPKQPYDYAKFLYENIVARKSPKAFYNKKLDKVLGYLERVNDGYYKQALEKLHSYRATKDKTKDTIVRFTSDYGIGIYTLDEMIRDLRIVPIETIEPIELPAGGDFIYIRNKKDVEVHLLDDNKNTLKVIKCKIDENASVNVIDLYRDIKVLPWSMSRNKQTRRLIPSIREVMYGESGPVFAK